MFENCRIEFGAVYLRADFVNNIQFERKHAWMCAHTKQFRNQEEANER